MPRSLTPKTCPNGRSPQRILGFSSWIPFLLLLILAAAAPASADWLEIEARYWQADLSGSSALDIEGFPVSLDLGQNLGLEVDDSLEGRLTIRPGLGFFLRGRYQTLSAEGAESVNVTLDLGDFGGIIGLGNINLVVDSRSSLDFDYAGAALGWQFTSPNGKLRIGPFVEAKGFRGDASILLSAFGQSQGLVEEFEAGFASVGGLLEIQPTDRLQIFAEVSVLVDVDEADLTDSEIGVRFFPTDAFGVGAGYRTLQVDGSIDDVFLDLDYEGAFATVLFRF